MTRCCMNVRGPTRSTPRRVEKPPVIRNATTTGKFLQCTSLGRQPGRHPQAPHVRCLFTDSSSRSSRGEASRHHQFQGRRREDDARVQLGIRFGAVSQCTRVAGRHGSPKQHVDSLLRKRCLARCRGKWRYRRLSFQEFPGVDAPRSRDHPYLKNMIQAGIDVKLKALSAMGDEMSVYAPETRLVGLVVTRVQTGPRAVSGYTDDHTQHLKSLAEILNDEKYLKSQIVELGACRFGIPRSKLNRLSRPQATASVRAALDHERSLGAIAEQAKRAGERRSA